MLSLSEFKSLLQVSDVTYDDLFSVYEPGVAGVVEQITGIRYGLSYTAKSTNGGNVLAITEEVYNDDVFAGAVITGDNLPDDTLVYDWYEHSITVDKRATASGSFTATVSPVPEPLKLAVAKMVLFDIKNSTDTTANSNDITAKSMGVLSLSYSKANALDSRYGYPKTLTNIVKRFGRTKLDIGRRRNRWTDITNHV